MAEDCHTAEIGDQRRTVNTVQSRYTDSYKRIIIYKSIRCNTNCIILNIKYWCYNLLVYLVSSSLITSHPLQGLTLYTACTTDMLNG